MAENYSSYVKERGVVKLKDGTEHEGRIDAGSAIGIVLRPKGSRGSLLIEAKDIESITVEAKGKPRLRRKVLPTPLPGRNREHLIERHGYAVSEIEAMDEASAKAFHDSLDHSDLGHSHREPTEAEKAISEAEDDE